MEEWATSWKKFTEDWRKFKEDWVKYTKKQELEQLTYHRPYFHWSF